MPRKTIEYRGYRLYTWKGMVARCHNPAERDYQYYGARGITVWEPWRKSFHRFVDDLYDAIGSRPEGCQLDRIDNTKGYEPGNLRWATSKTNNNNRRNNKLITWDGQTMSAAQWADVLGIPRQQIANRLNRGWSIEKTLTTPVGKRERLLDIDGVEKSITEWSKESGTPTTTIKGRLKRGWSNREAVYGEA